MPEIRCKDCGREFIGEKHICKFRDKFIKRLQDKKYYLVSIFGSRRTGMSHSALHISNLIDKKEMEE